MAEADGEAGRAAGAGAQAPARRGGAFAAMMGLALVGIAAASFASYWTGRPDASPMWDELTGATRGGVLVVEAPQVFTRERLVNDRFAQAQWLQGELVRTRDAEADHKRFAEPASRAIRSLSMSLGEGAPAGGHGGAANERGAETVLDPFDVLERRLAHRNRLRTELMDTQLDDGHDLSEHTLYRLNFDATAIPWRGATNRQAAVFLFEAVKPTSPEPLDGKARERQNDDDLELHRDIRAEMESLLSDAVATREDLLLRQGEIVNPANPGEAAAFSRLLQHELERRFVDFLLGMAGEDACEKIANTKDGDDIETLCKEKIRKEIGLPDSGTEPSKNLHPKLASSLLMARQAADTAVNLQRDYLRARDAACGRGDRTDRGVGSPGDAGASTGVPPSEPQSDRSQDAACLPLEPDISGQRAMQRLIGIIETMRHLSDRTDVGWTDIGAPGRCESAGMTLHCLLTTFQDNVPDTKNIRRAFCGFLGRDANCEINQSTNPRLSGTALEDETNKISRGPEICNEPLDIKKITPESMAQLYFCPQPPHLRRELIARLINMRLNDPLADNPMRRFFRIGLENCDFGVCQVMVQPRSTKELDGNDRTALRRAGLVPGGDDDKPRFDPYGAPPFIDERIECAKAVAAAMNGGRSARHAGRPTLWAEIVERYDACVMRSWLDGDTTDMAVYAVAPRAESRVRDVESALSLAAAATVGVGGRASAPPRTLERSTDATLIGFSALSDSVPQGERRERARFGWTLRSARGDEAKPVRLSAVISVPSWWSGLEIRVRACWVDERSVYAAQRAEASARADRKRADEGAKAERASDGTGSEGGLYDHLCVDDQPGDERRTFRLTLPRRAIEASTRFHLDVIKTPYFDAAWQRDRQSTRDGGLMLEAGRPGQLVLAGERLWRSTVVSLGGQVAERVEVLPDMRGIVAHFDCVQMPPGGTRGRAQAPTQSELVVWTAEGRTAPMSVTVHPFAGGAGMACPPDGASRNESTPLAKAVEGLEASVADLRATLSKSLAAIEALSADERQKPQNPAGPPVEAMVRVQPGGAGAPASAASPP